MKKIAFWARENKQTARLTIVICYILLNVIGLFLGDVIHSLNVELTPLFLAIAISLTLIGWMIYPSKFRRKDYRNYFWHQKAADLILVSTTFLFVVYLGNSLNSNWNSLRNPLQAASIANTNNPTNVRTSPVAKTTVSKKSLRKKIRAEIKRLRKAYKESSKADKTAYIIFAVLIAATLTVVLGAAACSISCSGSEALALVVFFVGLGGIVFGLIKWIQRITRGKPKG
jgi:uncharacterized membrane protein YraQ (UPF0718 family)